jgi:hypothetical protein
MAEDRYEALAFCCNCGYEGRVTPFVGMPVYDHPCPVCLTKMLRPVAQREWDRQATPEN